VAIDPKDIGELQKALNDAAGKASVLWTSFIIFQLYLVIAFGSVTHRDLFLENSIKLPVLNVDLPLVGFFVVVPIILVVFHFYIFLQLLALAAKAKRYDALLKQEAPASDRLREQLDSFVVLQFLAGPVEQRTGFVGFSLRFIGWVTLVAVPVIILIQGQLTFLPYHLAWVVWLQRFTLLIDLVVIERFWKRVGSSDDEPIIPGVRSETWSLLGTIAGFGIVLFSWTLATFPGELVDRSSSLSLISWRPSWSALHEVLFGGEPDPWTGRPNGLFLNRLVLTDQSFVDTDTFGELGVKHSFRGRDLRFAVLLRADLRKADFTGAALTQAVLSFAKLQNARFGCATEIISPILPRSSREEDNCGDLRGAHLRSANLQGASLERAPLDRADLGHAQLQGANFKDAQLEGANLGHARLQGANLRGAQLQGADLADVDMRGADLTMARLSAVSITPKPNIELIERDECDPNQKLLRDDVPGNVLGGEFCNGVSPKGKEQEKELAAFLTDLACSGSGPYVARGLLENGRIQATGAEAAAVANILRKGKSDPTACPGVIDFNYQDWAKVYRVDRSAPTPAQDAK
jgi:uncharacterized protein YjbI with pentapeptide repeats